MNTYASHSYFRTKSAWDKPGGLAVMFTRSLRHYFSAISHYTITEERGGIVVSLGIFLHPDRRLAAELLGTGVVFPRQDSHA